MLLLARKELMIFVCKKSAEFTVVPAKSDSDVVYCLQNYQRLIIDRSLVH